MRAVLLISGELRGFGHAFPTWSWLLEQVQQVYYFCSRPKPTETPISALIPAACGSYFLDRPILPDGTPAKRNDGPQQYFTTPWYKLRECFGFITGDADVVVRVRPDACFENRFDLATVKPGTLYVPRRFSWGMLNDQIALGDLPTMRRYCHFYDHLWRYRGGSEKRLREYWGKRPFAVMELNYWLKQADGSDRLREQSDWGV